jgi:hypothetical protein
MKTMGSKFGLTEVTTMESSERVSSRVTASTIGPTDRGIMVTGSKMRCRAQVYSSGLMAVIIKVSSRVA